MTIRTDLPVPARCIENVWIPLTDGCRLGARIWLPDDAEDNPVPAILEYIPYRKDDWTAREDSLRHPYFAGHGYASVRVDIRGSGDSDGILRDEYLPQEQLDAVEVIRWLGEQKWCTGAVGMIGISWGGFNGLQVAAHRPPELKAVISLCSTDDRYADDVHYMGGCVLGSDMLSWASTMLAFNARPPDPRVVGDRWREMWHHRLEETPPFIVPWLEHQRRDDYWKQGSVCEDYGDIACPVYMVGGWADAYRNAIFRFLAGYGGPRKGLIGPWGHNYPERGAPGPQIGFLQECLRWWDEWLKGANTGIMEEPMLKVWMQEAIAPRPTYLEWPGRWVAEPCWPPETITTRVYAINADGLGEEPHEEATLHHAGSQATGVDAGEWCPFGRPADFPPDQRAEDGRSLTFTSEPIRDRIEVLGFPDVVLTLASDKPNALVSVRLCDVSPSGASTLISRGLLNLTHRDSHEVPSPLEPGRPYTVTVRLQATGHVFPAGNRLRVALSSTYWPRAWPSPESVTLTLFTGGNSRLELPIRLARVEEAGIAPFGRSEVAAPLDTEVLRTGTTGRSTRTDVATGLVEMDFRSADSGFRLVTNGIEYDEFNQDTFSILEDNPLSATARSKCVIAIGRGGWRTRVETTSVMTADATRFHVTIELGAYEGDVRVFAKTWGITVPRDLV